MNASPPVLPQDLERLARRRAKAKMGWFVHATVYVCVNVGLALIALAKVDALAALPHAHDGITWLVWKLFPLTWWGIALLVHGAVVWLTLPGGSLYQRLLSRERDALNTPR